MSIGNSAVMKQVNTLQACRAFLGLRDPAPGGAAGPGRAAGLILARRHPGRVPGARARRVLNVVARGQVDAGTGPARRIRRNDRFPALAFRLCARPAISEPTQTGTPP